MPLITITYSIFFPFYSAHSASFIKFPPLLRRWGGRVGLFIWEKANIYTPDNHYLFMPLTTPETLSCHHLIVLDYFLESLRYTTASTKFLCRPAPSYHEYLDGPTDCGPSPQYMGFWAQPG